MKKSIMIPLAIFLFTLCIASFAMAENEDIPSYAMPIMETWNASSAEELKCNILSCWREERIALGEPAENHYNSEDWEMEICFDKTAEELIADPDGWHLAIVSSKKIDLQKLIDAGLLRSGSHAPACLDVIHHWLLSEKLRSLIPIHPSPYRIYDVYIHSYDEETDEAVLLVCKEILKSEKAHPNYSDSFAEEILRHRSVEEVRSTEGISLASKWKTNKQWTYEELLERPQDWDLAVLFIEKEGDWVTALQTIEKEDGLYLLEQAGLLYDFSQDEFFRECKMNWPLPNGVFGASGQMIGIPFVPTCRLDENNLFGTPVLILNAQSIMIPRALEFAKHYIKALEWTAITDLPFEHQIKYGFSISRDEMDW